ncbi:MAG TPA: YdaU family protein [Xanthobacteraceae bacterium]
MPAAPWMPFYIGDYMADTLHLTTEQHGAYFLLICACWTHGGFLPDDDAELAAITRLPLDAWKIARRKLAPFFKISGQKWRQKRVGVELQRAEHLHRVRSKAGSKGGSKSKARARVPQPQPEKREVGEAAKAKPQASELNSEKPSEPPTRAREDGETGQGEKFLGDWKPVGRCAPLAASRPERPTAALKTRRKELLRQKLGRFIDATMSGALRTAANAGLSGADPDHSEQWWFDKLDIQMRAQHWDDTREFWADDPPLAEKERIRRESLALDRQRDVEPVVE